MQIEHTSIHPTSIDPDVRLMLRIQNDDNAAFAEFVERFQHRLVAIIQHLVGNVTEAEDLAQEAFLRVYRSRKQYTPKAKLSTWLFTIANNLVRNALRDRQRRPAMPLTIGDSSPMGQHPTSANASRASPTHNLQQEELAEVVRQALDGLNERQRLAIVLNKFEDMSYADIAEVMGLTSKGIKSLLSRARVKLREALQGYVYMDCDPPPERKRDNEEDTF